MYLKISRFFYNAVKDNVEANDCYYRLHVIESLLYVFLIGRVLNIIVMLQFPWYEPWRYDWMAYFIYNNSRMYDTMMMMLLIMLCLVALVGKRYLHFARIDTWVWRINYELVVLNTDLYCKHCRPQAEVDLCIFNREVEISEQFKERWPVVRFVPETILIVYIKIFAKWQSWLRLDHVNQETFSQECLPILSHLPIKTRLRLAQFVLVVDFISIGFHILTGFSIVGFVIFYYEFIFAPHPLWYLILVSPDMTVIFNHVFVLTQVALEFNLIATVLAFTYHQHVESLLRKLRSLKSIYLTKKKVSLLLVYYSRLLYHCYREHGFVSYYIVYCNREAWSNGLYGFVAISIPINLYLSSRLFLDVVVTKFELFLIGVICILLNVVCGFVLVAFSMLSKQMHRPRKVIYSLVPVIPGATLLTLKLKYDNFYHRLSHKRKYGMSIGPWTTLTYRSIFKLILVYIAYFLFVFNLRLEMRANAEGNN